MPYAFKRRSYRKRPKTGALPIARRRFPTRYPRIRRTFRTKGSRPPVVALKRHSDQAFRIAYNNAGTITTPNATLAAIPIVASQEVSMHLFAFRLEDVPNDSEFRALFRYYKLNGVSMNFSMAGTTAFSQDSQQGNPVMSYMFAPLLDSTNMPTTLQQFREYSSYKKFYFGDKDKRMKSIFIRPRILNRNSDIAGNTTDSVGKKQWIDTVDKTIQHTGLLVNFDNTRSTLTTHIDLELTYYFTFKGTR